jgi:hypothetical protein
MNWKCKILGHKWIHGCKTGKYCVRCWEDWNWGKKK